MHDTLEARVLLVCFTIACSDALRMALFSKSMLYKYSWKVEMKKYGSKKNICELKKRKK